jgi:hypothetical protein
VITRNAISNSYTSMPASASAPAAADPTLADQLHELLALPAGALEHAMAARILRENDLEEDARHRATHERLCAWLELDPEDARIIARAFEQAISRLDSAVRERRVETERAVILNGMSVRQFRYLAPLIDWLRRPPFHPEVICDDEASTAA